MTNKEWMEENADWIEAVREGKKVMVKVGDVWEGPVKAIGFAINDHLHFAAKSVYNSNEWDVYSDWKPYEEPAPSHEDIMTKWWELDNHRWAKVSKYYRHHNYLIESMHVGKKYFIGRNSADIPTEEYMAEEGNN